MIQEDRKLILTDLCARLPYEVYAETINELGETHINRISPENINLVFSGWFKECKPYLRPMSSMTEDERKEIGILIRENRPSPYGVINNKGIDNLLLSVSVTSIVLIDWLNSHHFDYRGLIEKGLALEAPRGMYSIKEQ